ncbi:MAG: ribosome biogenesis GTPase Der [Bdellovibrionales bacterium]|nr:ribosome biogenesis GTPase Der [Bdellovibrionales bacterium]
MSSIKTYRLKNVAIIGRPNVGKSTLFNILTDSRKALVKNQPGVTRDIRYDKASWRDRQFEVIDTGGLTDSNDIFSQLIKEQVLELLKSVDAVVFVTDARAGLCPEDRDVLKIIKKANKPHIVAVNKIDSHTDLDTLTYEFLELGEKVIGCSFENRFGTTDVLEWIYEQIGEQVMVEVPNLITLAIVGKPNAGKSSLTNELLGENRMLVSEVAGTTTDSIDSYIQRGDRQYCIVDTAGLRKKNKRRKDGLEMLSGIQSIKSIKRADIVLLVVDGLIGPTDQDAKVLNEVIASHKGVILVVNKSDVGRKEIDDYRQTLREQTADTFHFFDDIPVVFISAKLGHGINELFECIEETWRKLNFRVSTSDLNDFFIKVIRRAPAPVAGTKNVKFYYATQTQQRPPSFMAFANRPDGVTNAYRRFLVNQIKENWNLKGVPVRVFAIQNKGKEL